MEKRAKSGARTASGGSGSAAPKTAKREAPNAEAAFLHPRHIERLKLNADLVGLKRQIDAEMAKGAKDDLIKTARDVVGAVPGD